MKRYTPYFVPTLVMMPFIVVAAIVFRDKGVKSEYFAVVAQVIPVLVLAYLVENRGQAESLLQAKVDLQRIYHALDTTKSLLNELAEAWPVKDTSKAVHDEGEDLTPPDGMLSYDEELETLDFTAERLKTSNLLTAMAAGLGEAIALYAFAAGSESYFLFTASIGILLFQGVVLVKANSTSMEALVLRVHGSVHQAKVDESRVEYDRLRAKQNILMSAIATEMMREVLESRSSPSERSS